MNSVADVWARTLDELRDDLTPTAMNTWFSDCEPVELTSSKLVVYTPQEFKRGIINSRFAPRIKAILADIFSCDFGFQVLAEGELEVYKPGEGEIDSALPEMQDYTFDRFIVGGSNKFAHAAAVGVAENPGKVYNPLFIYGNSGLGKTHLLLAIGKRILDRKSSAKVAYVKGDDFTNAMVSSLKEGTQDEFRHKYRYVDLFLVDDIQFIAGKMGIQEEFFHTFNTLYEAGKQIVITSDRPPNEIYKLEDRLKTRFEGGLIADVQQPDFETRMAITTNKALRLGLDLPQNIVEFIADNCTSNVRQLEGVIKRLTAYNDLMNVVIDEDEVRRAIKDVVRLGVYVPSLEVIIEETAKYYTLTPEDLRGQRRTKHLAESRQVAMYLMRSLTNTSLVDIGREFGDRNHATVLSSVRKIEEMMGEPEMSGIIRDISSNINSRSEANSAKAL